MIPLPNSLPIPDTFDQSSSMWIDEAIWGHRLYDEQLPWMVFLEFLNVFLYELGKERALEEPNGLNTLKYRAAHRLYLRNILCNAINKSVHAWHWLDFGGGASLWLVVVVAQCHLLFAMQRSSSSTSHVNR